MPRDGNKTDLGTNLVTPRQLEKYLGITRQTRYNWEKAGKIPARDRHGGWSRKLIDDWEEEYRIDQASKAESRKRINRKEPS